MAVSDYSTTASDNTSISGLTVTDSTVANTLDDIIRQMMADIRAADDANAKTASLATMATQDADDVAITGGTIDGTVIGAATPAAGTFTTALADTVRIQDAAAEIRMLAENTASTHNNQSIVNSASELTFRTLSSAGSIVSNDYVQVKGASGVISHSLRSLGTERLLVNSGGVSVAGTLTVQTVSIANGSHITPAVGVGTPSSNLGELGGNRWANIYLSNAPVVVSDARLKENIRDLNEAERAAASKIKTRTFTMKDTRQRKIGYIAQEVIEAMASEGLCAFEYGLVTGGEVYGVDMDAINAFRFG